MVRTPSCIYHYCNVTALNRTPAFLEDSTSLSTLLFILHHINTIPEIPLCTLHLLSHSPNPPESAGHSSHYLMSRCVSLLMSFPTPLASSSSLSPRSPVSVTLSPAPGFSHPVSPVTLALSALSCPCSIPGSWGKT